jgi:phosphatidylserine/phosphatidylglycerophosphate/cardiolipin synthase-like enzyme
LRYLEHDELYSGALLKALDEARRSLWLATASLKETLVEAGAPSRLDGRGRRRRFAPLAEALADLARGGVEVRLLHGGAPSERFAASLVRSGALDEPRFALRRCRRVHFKALVVDGRAAYAGSANLTGAGLGAKSAERRNFEAGFWLEEPEPVGRLAGLFSAVWSGAFCEGCLRRDETCLAP